LAEIELEDGPFRIFVSNWLAAPGRLPENEIVCAIGDVHGRLAHLRALTGWLIGDVFRNRDGRRSLITLGDYVDRGPCGIGVLSFLGQFDPPGVRVTRLIGNHDMFLNTFLHDEAIDLDFIAFWLKNGGGSTARELGIEREDFYREDLRALQARARARLPAAAAECLASLRRSERIGSYLFVHAGVDPGRPLEDHDITELVTMREPFLSGREWRHDFVVVHGHTVCGPDVQPHRISCDSGAFLTGVLTCAQIEADRLRFVIATEAAGPSALDRIPARRSAAPIAWTERPVP
jgi:serine/threonine protein phosphatase 1